MRDPTRSAAVVLFLMFVVAVWVVICATGCTIVLHYHAPVRGATTSQPADADALSEAWVDEKLQAAIER